MSSVPPRNRQLPERERGIRRRMDTCAEEGHSGTMQNMQRTVIRRMKCIHGAMNFRALCLSRHGAIFNEVRL